MHTLNSYGQLGGSVNINSTIPLFSTSEFSSLYPSPEIAYPVLCQTWSETPEIFSRDAAHLSM